MRLFLGIPLDAAIKSALRTIRRDLGILPVRWLQDENLHITLIPPWEGEPEAAIAALEMMGPKIPALNLELDRVEFGPDPRRPRLIWAAGETPAGLLDLKRELENALGLAPEKREYRLHATLAVLAPEKFRDFPVQDLYLPVAWSMPAQMYALIRSELRPEGARHTILREFSFRGEKDRER